MPNRGTASDSRPICAELSQVALPVGHRFPNWRDGDDAALREWLDLPTAGILFDIEHNGFWLSDWGERPTDLEDAKRIAPDRIAAAPRLVPVAGHRMMPDEPTAAGNPVNSVHQTDIIYYGSTLAEYIDNDFGAQLYRIGSEQRSIRFWAEFIA